MWTERQAAMLREMGLALHTPPLPAAPAAPAAPAVATAATDAAAATTASPPAPLPVPARPGPPAAPVASSAVVAAAAPRAPALPSAVATLDWPALRAAVAGCQACGLCSTRRQTVFGSGHTGAHWMVVGEAPGADEDASGEPFVGAAGQLLDAMLRALSLSRAEDGELPPSRRVYIANTLKCRPPGNRNPAPEEMAQCEPFLVRQIELLRPRLILAMGRFAVQALLRSSEPLGRLRGRVHRYQGVPLVVTYHPAYLLRSPAEKGKAWDDLCLAAEVAEQAEQAAAGAP